jgi:hypothetical protein
VDGATPDAGVAESHSASPDATQESVPPPAFATDTAWEAGLAPPGCPVNARAVGVTDNAEAGPGEDDDPPPEHPVIANRSPHTTRVRAFGIPPPGDPSSDPIV